MLEVFDHNLSLVDHWLMKLNWFVRRIVRVDNDRGRCVKRERIGKDFRSDEGKPKR